MKFEDTGLEDKPLWREAFALGYAQILSMVNGEEKRATPIYKSRVLSIATTLMENCDDVTDESVAVALLNMAAPKLYQDATERAKFNDKVMDILMLRGLNAPDFSENKRDARRTVMAEQIVIMEHQMQRWKQVDQFHEKRHEMVQNFEQSLELYQRMGIDDQKLLDLYAEKLVDAKEGMKRLDAKKTADSAFKPKPPRMG